MTCLYIACTHLQDLKSSNMMLVSMALIITCKLIGAEMIPPLLPLVQEKLFHPKYGNLLCHYSLHCCHTARPVVRGQSRDTYWLHVALTNSNPGLNATVCPYP